MRRGHVELVVPGPCSRNECPVSDCPALLRLGRLTAEGAGRDVQCCREEDF